MYLQQTGKIFIFCPSKGAVYKPRGQKFGQFWAILTPSPLCRHFYLIAVIKCCGHLSNPPSPLICPRGLYMPPKGHPHKNIHSDMYESLD